MLILWCLNLWDICYYCEIRSTACCTLLIDKDIETKDFELHRIKLILILRDKKSVRKFDLDEERILIN